MLRVLEYGYLIRMVETTSEIVGVDTPEDLERAKILMKNDSLLINVGRGDSINELDLISHLKKNKNLNFPLNFKCTSLTVQCTTVFLIIRDFKSYSAHI